MAVGGLLALLEDITSTLDDVSTMEQLAVEKSAKIAEDDVTGTVQRGKKLDPKHEISVIMAVAKGSLKNKLLYFIPTTFAIATLAPWAVAPLSVASGLYISYEGTKKFLERTDPVKAARRRAALQAATDGGKETLLRYEQDRISQAIKTDAALSLELAGIHIGMATGAPLLTKLAILTVAGIGTTTIIYAGIIGIIKMDDVALHLAERKGTGPLAKAQRSLGRGMLRMAGPVMKGLTGVGMTALFYLGGHLLAENVPLLHQGIEKISDTLAHVGIFESVVTISTMIAAGVSSGFAAVGISKVVEKPVGFVKDKTVAGYKKHLSPGISGIRNGIKKTWQRGMDKTLRRGAAKKAPQAEAPQIMQFTLPPEPVEKLLQQKPQQNQPVIKVELPDSGTLAQSFERANTPQEPAKPQQSPKPVLQQKPPSL